MVRGQLDLLLLGALRRGPQHGYALITSLYDGSGGHFDLAEGTVYPALHKLERDGSVSSSWSLIEGRRRRVYELTPAGRAALASRRKEWALFARAVDAVLA